MIIEELLSRWLKLLPLERFTHLERRLDEDDGD